MPARISYLAALLLSAVSFVIFLYFLATGIFGGDSGDLVTAATLGGIPHPPGYPLYTFLGFLLSKLPFFTPAWRVGILSAGAHALVVGLIFLIVARLTKKMLPAMFASLALLANYLFFLYAVTTEVFGLLDLFLVVLIYLLMLWHQTKKIHYLYWASFVFGLSLTHHPLILFFVPAVAYLFWINKKFLKLNYKQIIGLLAYWLIGLLPLVYIPLAGCGKAIVNWDQVCSIPNFIRLISRADYGIFTSGAIYGSAILSRLLGIKAYFEILIGDLTWPGVVLIILGFWYLYRGEKKLANFFMISFLLLGPIFIFYASFPIFSNFNFATFERFLLPSYMLVYILVGLGFTEAVELVNNIIKRSSITASKLGRTGFIIILFLYPLVMIPVTAYKFVGLSGDQTANNLGRDILFSLPPKSILLIAHDTPLFTTQYVRYALNFRSDTIIIHLSILENTGYPQLVKKVFPRLTVPKSGKSGITLPFIKANREVFPIFSNTLIPLDAGWFWVPYGLVYKLTDEVNLPVVDKLSGENMALWQKMHDPNQGILSHYDHLMLGDVRNVYANARAEYARILLKGNKIDEAINQLKAALAYHGDTGVPNIYTLLGLSELFLNHCQMSLNYLQMAQAASPATDKDISFYEGVAYRDCAKNAPEAQKLFDEYEKLQSQEETPLKQ